MKQNVRRTRDEDRNVDSQKRSSNVELVTVQSGRISAISGT